MPNLKIPTELHAGLHASMLVIVPLCNVDNVGEAPKPSYQAKLRVASSSFPYWRQLRLALEAGASPNPR